jgi:hypothetical protein
MLGALKNPPQRDGAIQFFPKQVLEIVLCDGEFELHRTMSTAYCSSGKAAELVDCGHGFHAGTMQMFNVD